MGFRAVQFGAGNIGRGFLGQLYFESGIEAVYIDVVDDVVRLINERRAYPLRIVGNGTQEMRITGVSAIHGRDVDAVSDALATADLGATAVGVNVLPKVAPSIAAGLRKRFRDSAAKPLDFIVCENMIGAGAFLREEVRKHLEPAFHAALDEQAGFVEASIGRMVPIMTAEQRAEDPLLICVEPYCELPVDATGFRGAIPPLKNLHAHANFQAYVERKLFVHNMAHAATACLGYLRGHEYIWQAITDPRVREVTEGAMKESCAGLAARHRLDEAELATHSADLVRRFHNKALADQVARVANDPIRKLGPHDRFVGAAQMCLEYGIEPVQVAFATAAAIRYDHPADAAAQDIQHRIHAGGVERVLSDICKLPADSHLAELIRGGLARLDTEGWLNTK